MNDKSLDEQIEEGLAIKQMMTSEGWKIIHKLILETQEKAFSDWAELDTDAKPEKVNELRFTKKVLGKLLAEINLIVELGTEAINLKEVEKERSITDAMFIAEKSSDSELDRLSVVQSFFDRFGDRFRGQSAGTPVSNGPKG